MKAVATHFFYYLFALIFFIADIACCALFHKQLIYGLLCMFIIALLHTRSLLLWLFLTLLLSLEAFFYYGSCWVALIYIVPLTLGALHIRSSFYDSYAHRYLLLLLAIGAIVFYIEPYMLGLYSSPTYISTKIFATLAVLTGISWILG